MQLRVPQSPGSYCAVLGTAASAPSACIIGWLSRTPGGGQTTNPGPHFPRARASGVLTASLKLPTAPCDLSYIWRREWEFRTVRSLVQSPPGEWRKQHLNPELWGSKSEAVPHPPHSQDAESPPLTESRGVVAWRTGPGSWAVPTGPSWSGARSLALGAQEAAFCFAGCHLPSRHRTWGCLPLWAAGARHSCPGV